MTRPVVGIDLSLTSTGVAIIGGGKVQLHRIESKGAKDATVTERWDRACGIVNKIEHLVPSPCLVVIEQPAYSRTTGHMHDRSGLWWLAVHTLLNDWNHVVEVTPSARARYGAGKGNAGKDAVLAAVVRRYPDVEVTGNDVADALVLAAMGARWLGEPLEESLPQAHLAAMDGVRWPEGEAA